MVNVMDIYVIDDSIAQPTIQNDTGSYIFISLFLEWINYEFKTFFYYWELKRESVGLYPPP